MVNQRACAGAAVHMLHLFICNGNDYYNKYEEKECNEKGGCMS